MAFYTQAPEIESFCACYRAVCRQVVQKVMQLLKEGQPIPEHLCPPKKDEKKAKGGKDDGKAKKGKA